MFARPLSGLLARASRSRRAPPLLFRLAQLFALRRHRRQLRNLDDRMLQDIGITRREAREESQRPFWDAPDHWRH